MTDTTIAFNAAINFALDGAEGEGLLFLNLWREGDWESIAREFPDFDLATTGQVKIATLEISKFKKTSDHETEAILGNVNPSILVKYSD